MGWLAYIAGLDEAESSVLNVSRLLLHMICSW